jgi:hypothetical protein
VSTVPSVASIDSYTDVVKLKSSGHADIVKKYGGVGLE